MEVCAPFDASLGYAIELSRFVDCQAAALGQDGYAALAASDSPVILALGGLLTILLAVQGYRLLLGEQLQVRDGVLLAAKVGLVLAFATQWPAFHAVVYNLTVDAPQQISALLPGGDGSAGRSFPARVETSHQVMAELTRPSPASLAAAASEAQPAPPPRSGEPPSLRAPNTRMFPLAGNVMLMSADVLFLVSGLALLLSVRLIAGLLLALGPLFFACLLFDTTRGIFEGWVRALVGTAIASIAIGAVFAIEITILEAQLMRLVAAIEAETVPALVPSEIMATILIFTLALVAGLVISLRVGSGFGFIHRGVALATPWLERWRQESSSSNGRTEQLRSEARADTPSRAAMIADAVRISDQRYALANAGGGAVDPSRRIEISASAATPSPTTPLGQTHRRNSSLKRTRRPNQKPNRS